MKLSLATAAAVAFLISATPMAIASSTDKKDQRLHAWTQSIERTLLSHLDYTGGDRRGARREPEVRFTVSAEGVVGDIRLVRTSGFAPADRAALRAVELTNTVRRPPQAASQTVSFRPVLITPRLHER